MDYYKFVHMYNDDDAFMCCEFDNLFLSRQQIGQRTMRAIIEYLIRDLILRLPQDSSEGRNIDSSELRNPGCDTTVSDTGQPFQLTSHARLY